MSDKSFCCFRVPRIYSQLVGYVIANGCVEADIESWSDEHLRELFDHAYSNGVDDYHTEQWDDCGAWIELSQPDVTGGGLDEAQQLAGWGIPFQHEADACEGSWDAYRSCCNGVDEWDDAYHGDSGYQIPFDAEGVASAEVLLSTALFHSKWRSVTQWYSSDHIPQHGSIAAKWRSYVLEMEGPSPFAEYVKHEALTAQPTPVKKPTSYHSSHAGYGHAKDFIVDSYGTLVATSLAETTLADHLLEPEPTAEEIALDILQGDD